MLLYQIKFITTSVGFKGISIKSNITSIAIGGFDGMHLAHQQLFSKLDKNGAIVVIETPYANLSPSVYRTRHTPYPLFYYGLENIKHLSGEAFIKLLQEEFPKLQKIVVGYDFHFGFQAKSGIEDLKSLFDGELVVVEEYQISNIAIHSRVIREYLRQGDIAMANTLLGYPYRFKGRIIKGQGLGSKQFVATINLDIEEFLIPQEGVYVTKTYLQENRYPSVSFIGHRVSTDGKFAVETHLLDGTELPDLPKHIEVEFYEKIRENKRYDSYEDLKHQILDDITETKKWFKREKK